MTEEDKTIESPPLSKRGYVYFPRELKYVGSSGSGRLVTRVEHSLPDDNRVVWTSRRHRKKRGLKLGPPNREHTEPPDRGRAARLKSAKEKYLYWGFRPRVISWWVAFLFTCGSILFMIGAIPQMVPAVVESKTLDTYVNVFFFAGSLFFTTAAYVQLLEALNVDVDIGNELREKKIIGSQQEAGPENPQEKRRIWFSWRSDRLSFWASLTQFSGTIVFNVNCFFAIFAYSDWVRVDLLVWAPSTIASILFVTSSYVLIMEVSHGYWSWRFRQISWWVTIFTLLGSIGFLVSSVFGFFGQGPIHFMSKWSINLVLLLGCISFLISSYLMIPEMLNKQTKTKAIAET